MNFWMCIEVQQFETLPGIFNWNVLDYLVNYSLLTIALCELILDGLLRWLNGKESACQGRRYKRCKFSPWIGKVPGEGNGSVQSLSRVQLFATPWIAAFQASLSITNFRSSLRLMSIESVIPSSHLILGRPLLLLPPILPSIRDFSNESTLRMRWPKYWGFSFSIIPSKEIPGLISFRMDWLDLLAVQGTL